jgi:tetratricopeptide (TPR) repeat protein/serine/threonine protein kinase
MVADEMRIPLAEGEHLEFIVDGQAITYTIRRVIGYGGSCIVYRAERPEAAFCGGNRQLCRTAIIKEFYPCSLTQKIRRYGRHLFVGGMDAQKSFESLRRHFLNGYLNHVAFYENDTNHMLPRPTCSEANNTVYTILEPTNGDSLDTVRDDVSGVFEIAQIILPLCNAVRPFHEHKDGIYLYLDIKPENIFLFRKDAGETRRVALFDFDTVMLLDDILKKKIPNRVSSEGWAPPEQEQWLTRSFGKATDIYAMGAVLFWLITGNKPNEADLYAIQRNKLHLMDSSVHTSILTGESEALVKKIFSKTLRAATKSRYQNIRELQNDLQNLLEITQPAGATIAGKIDETNRLMRENLEAIRKSTGLQMRIVHSVPVALATFTDRDDKIREIGERLQKFGWTLISGMGGIGKTELAKEYIHRNKEKYNTVCFLSYDGSLLSTIGLSLPVFGYEAENENIEFHYDTKMKLLKTYGEDTLIVIDNFNRTKDDSGKYVSAVFDEKFSDVRSGKYHIIFTSRLSHDGCLELGELEGVYQNELFFKYYTKEFSDDDRRAITGILNIISGHTLTLVLIAKTLFTGRRVSPKVLLEKLSVNLKTDIPANVTHEKDGEIYSGLMYAHIESIFDISMLFEREKYILMNMSLTPNVGIKAETFGDWIRLDDFNDFDVLVDTGWIILERKTDIASLHPVVSEVLANALKPDSLTCERYLTSLNGYLSTLDKGTDWITNNLAIGLCTSVLKRIPDKVTLTGRILYNLGKIYYQLSIFNDSQKCLLEALSIYEMENQENIDQNELAGLYRWVGISYSELANNKKAMEYYLKALNLHETIENPDYQDFARTLNVLGSSSKVLASYPETLQYHLAALKVQQEHLPENHPDLASTYNCLGVYYNSQGEYDNSLPNFLKSLEIRQLSLPANHRYIAMSLNNIAWVYSRKGYLDDAMDYYIRALKIKKEMLPENHSGMALAYYNIGHIYELKNELDVASEYYQKALQIRVNLNVENKPRTATIYRGLCSVCREKKQFDDALVWIDKSIEIYRQNGRAGLPSSTASYDNKGYVYRDKGDFDEAMVYFNMAFDIRRKKFDDSHPHIATSYCNFADVYLGKGQYETAIEYYQKALNIRLLKFPENHSEILLIYKNLASAYRSIDDNDMVNVYLEKANISETMLDDSNSEE